MVYYDGSLIVMIIFLLLDFGSICRGNFDEMLEDYKGYILHLKI